MHRLRFVGVAAGGSVAVVAALQILAIAGLIEFEATLALELALVATAISGLLYVFLLRHSRKEWERLIERADHWTQRLVSLFDDFPEALIIYAQNGRVRRVNTAARDLLAFPSNRVPDVWGDHVPARERGAFEERFRAAMNGAVERFETAFVVGAGKEIPVGCILIPTILEGRVVGMVAMALDLQHERKVETTERLQRERIAAIAAIESDYASHPAQQIQKILEFSRVTLDMDEGCVSFVMADTLRVGYSATPNLPAGLEISLSRTFARHTYGSREVLAVSNALSEKWRNDDAVVAHEWRSYVGLTIFVGSRPYGIVYFLGKTPRAADFDEADHNYMRIVAALVGSLLERVHNEELLAREAHLDLVSGLWNRVYFEEQLHKAMAREQGGEVWVRVHYIDLDGFKAVNDRYGHAAGDEVLRIFGTRLRALVRVDDVVARIGGDEFAVLDLVNETESRADALGRRIVSAAIEPMYVGDAVIEMSASIGVAVFPRDALSEDSLLKCADSAMYEAKTAGKGSVRLYSNG